MRDQLAEERLRAWTTPESAFYRRVTLEFLGGTIWCHVAQARGNNAVTLALENPKRRGETRVFSIDLGEPVTQMYAFAAPAVL